MGKEIIRFGDIEIENNKFHYNDFIKILFLKKIGYQ